MRSSHFPLLPPLLMLALAGQAAAFPQQGSVPGRGTPAITRDMRYREWNLKNLGKNGAAGSEKATLAWGQIKEDFERMQTVSIKLMRSLADGSAPDYGAVSEAAAEIRKRAARLKTNLPLPEPERLPEPGRLEGLQLRTMLSALDGRIVKFVQNPIFKDAEVVDAGRAAEARADLERIIEVSAVVKKTADELKKSGAGK